MSGVALITGGQQGIGLGIARALVGAGFRVALAAERAADAPEVAAALAELGPQGSYFTHDIRDIDAVPALLDTITAQLGPVTTLVSNAGVPARLRGDMLALTPENFDHVMDINLRGGFFLAQQVAQRMLQAPAGPYRSLIFITSVSAAMASVERAEYCISKAGAAMMTQLFALRLAGDGIGVYEIRPGIIATDMTAGVREAYSQRISSGLVPAGRWGEPADIGAVILPMATGQMAFATGAVVPVDGGLSLARL